MFIANNSIFKSIMQYFFSQINNVEGVLPNNEFLKKFILPFSKYPLKCKFDGQTLIKCDFWKVGYPNIFFRKYVPLVVSKPHTKSQQLSLSKTAILEHP